MPETVALHRYMDVGHDWAKHRAALMATVAGVIVAIFALWVAQPAARLFRSALAHPAGIELNLAYPTPELPREWRWEPGAVSFDQMFREDAAVPGELDWIGDPEHRAR